MTSSNGRDQTVERDLAGSNPGRSNTAGLFCPRKRRNVVEETLFLKYCSLNFSSFARTNCTCCGNTFCLREAKSASELFQKRFVSTRGVSLQSHTGKHLT